jgi:hypothetical protein
MSNEAIEAIEAVAAVEVDEKVDTAKASVSESAQRIKKCTIALDKTTENVIELDAGGVELVFDSTPGKFLELPDGVIQGLSARNKSSYFAAFHSHAKEKRQQGLEPTVEINVNARGATAGDRMAVDYPPGFLDKYHPCWKRTDELQACQAQGYSFVREEDGAQSFAYDKTRGFHVVGKPPHEEMYLMKIPVEKYNELMKVSEDRSRRNNGAAEEAFMEEAEKLGGKPTNTTRMSTLNE